MSTNTLAAEHKQRLRSIFDAVAPGYDRAALRFFPFCADRMLSRLCPRPGEKILDVATGTGIAAIGAAQMIRPGGRVTGIDLSEVMLERAEQNIRKTGLSNVDLHIMDAAELDFRSNYFHAVICGLGLSFMPDMLGALKEWKRVVRPGGKLMFTCFGSEAFQPMNDWLCAGLEAHGVDVGAHLELLAWHRLSDPRKCHALLNAAGLVDVTVVTESLGYHLREAQEWWEIVWNSGFRGVLLGLQEEERERLRSEHLAEVHKLMTDRGLWVNVATHFASGRKPRADPGGRDGASG